MRKTKLIFFVLIGIFLGVLGGSLLLNRVTASENGHTKVCICHNYKHNPHTVCADRASILEGHGRHLISGFDKWGRCPEPTPTPTPTPQPRWHYECEKEECIKVRGPGENECKCDFDCEKPTPTPTPTPTPDPTPTPEPEPEVHRSEPGPASAPQCEDTAPVKVGANFHILRNGSVVIAKWTPTEGNIAHIYYKQVDASDWEHSLRDVPNDGYQVINVDGQDYTFALQQANGCAGGPLTNEVVDGDTDGWILFR